MKITKNLYKLLLVTLVFFASCEEEDVLEQRLSSSDPRNIAEIVSATPELSTLASGWTQVKLDSVLNAVSTSYTLFAPDDAAFGNVDVSALSKQALTNVILNHIISTTTPDFTSTMTTGYLKTLAIGPDENNLSFFTNTDGDITLNGVSKLVSGSFDKGATNGILHTVDAVLMPPTIVDHVLANPNYSSLAAAIQRAELEDTLNADGPFTLFAPNNAAFEKFIMDVSGAFGWNSLNDIPKEVLKEVLLYHTIAETNSLAADVEGTTLETVQKESFSVEGGVIDDASYKDANIVLTDIQGINGVVHGVDKVLLPNTTFQSILDKTLNLIERADDKGYSVFTAAIKKAGLTADLTNNELTAFVPNNGAFTTFFLTIEKFDSLDDFDTPEDLILLKKLLQYHLYAGSLMASSLTTDLSIKTVQGDSFVYNGTSFVSSHANAPEAFINNSNIGASNAIIHEIDNVLVSDDVASALGYPVPASGAAVYGYEIYDDALADFWVGGWTSPDFANTEQVKSGVYAIKVDFAGNDGFQIGDRNKESLAAYTTANATLYSENGTTVKFILNEQWGLGQTVNIPAGKWTDVSIPIANLVGATTELDQFVIQDASGTANTLYIDQVGLDVTFQAAIPTFAYEIYTEDNLNANWVGGWSAPVFNSTSNTSTGLYAVEVALDANAGLQLGGTNEDLSAYSVVKFSVYCDTASEFKLVMNEQWDGYILKPTAGQWNHFTVPLADALYGTTSYTQFVIQEISGNNVTLFVDDIGFD